VLTSNHHQDRSVIVRDVFENIFKPYPRHIRQALLSHFYRGLYRKAHVIIQHVDAIGASPKNPMTDEDIRCMRQVHAFSALVCLCAFDARLNVFWGALLDRTVDLYTLL
jgi:hypothetical protein